MVMDRTRDILLVVVGFATLVMLALAVVAVVFWIPNQANLSATDEAGQTVVSKVIATQEAVATLARQEPAVALQPTFTPSPSGQTAGVPPSNLTDLYGQLAAGVVSIQVITQGGGAFGGGGGVAAGSGFIIDNQGHIVTNNHVVADAQLVTVKFENGIEADAEIVGTDVDSDLAVIQVQADQMPDMVHAVALGNSDDVQPGQWVFAIGNPFGFGGSITAGIVSAVGRTIESQTPFAIPHAIQTDAAINPGNSGGPLFNLDGQVIGVNAQIVTGGSGQANSGVGFAIPVNIVRRVVPVLIQTGEFQWPWLGIRGTSVDLLIQQADNLPTQQGAYVGEVVSGSPADQAGLQGATGSTQIAGITVPTGGDVIVAANGESIIDYPGLQFAVANRSPGDQLKLTVLRDGERVEVTVTLAARPQNMQSNNP
jgi:S1-C subfamily serine protease